MALHKSLAAFLRSDEVLVPPDAVMIPLITATPSTDRLVMFTEVLEPEFRICMVPVASAAATPLEPGLTVPRYLG